MERGKWVGGVVWRYGTWMGEGVWERVKGVMEEGGGAGEKIFRPGGSSASTGGEHAETGAKMELEMGVDVVDHRLCE